LILIEDSFFPFLEIMASRMAMSYELQIIQVNEKLPPKSSLDLTLTQHLRDENPKPQEVRACFAIKPFQAWYYRIFQTFAP
jgi:hypothetical protein